MKDKKVLTADEVAEYLRISTQQVYKLIKSGQIKATNIGKGKIRKEYRITPKDVKLFLKQNQE
jgi:excisionase family DNA binding protein